MDLAIQQSSFQRAVESDNSGACHQSPNLPQDNPCQLQPATTPLLLRRGRTLGLLFHLGIAQLCWWFYPAHRRQPSMETRAGPEPEPRGPDQWRQGPEHPSIGNKSLKAPGCSKPCKCHKSERFTPQQSFLAASMRDQPVLASSYNGKLRRLALAPGSSQTTFGAGGTRPIDQTSKLSEAGLFGKRTGSR